MIAREEGCRLKAYRCPAGVWTCGWGETEGVTATTSWTQDYADNRFCDSLTSRAQAVSEMCAVLPSDNELGAMVSLAYNIGLDAFRKSTVLKQHNLGNHQAASRAFGLWNKAKVQGVLQELPGLTARRAAEGALYLRPAEGAPRLRMPQAVALESSLAKSPIAASGAVAAGTGVLSLLGQAGDQVGVVSSTAKTAKTMVVDTLGLPEGMFLPLVLVVIGLAVAFWRHKQRAEGWV